MTIRAPDATALYNEFAIPAFDEAAFLYYQRKQKCAHRLGLLTDIAELDQRLKSNLDHLLYFHQAARFLSEERLPLADESDAFVGTCLSIFFEDTDWIQKVFSTYLEQENGVEAIATALAWMPPSHSAPWIKKLLSSKDLQHKYLSLRACELLNHYPREALNRLINRDDCREHTPLYKTLLSVLGRSRLEQNLNVLYAATSHEDQDIRDAACQACLLNGDTRALDMAMHRSLESNEAFHIFAPLIVRSEVSQARQAWFAQALKKEKIALELRVLAVGDYGDSRGVPWLIHYMEHPTYAPFAAYAFRQITGLDLRKHKLVKADEASRFLRVEHGGSAGDEPDETFLGEDHSLPFPDGDRLQQLWSDYRKHFIPGQRYVLGRQHAPKDLEYVEFLKSLKNTNILGDRVLVRRELSQLKVEPASSDFVPSQYGE